MKEEQRRYPVMARLRCASIAGLALATMVGLATPVFAAENSDPWEGVNRGVYKVNDWVDRKALRPTATFYTKIVPGFLRRGVNNFFDNLATPGVAINQLLQGKGRASLSDTGRFLVNTTVGIGGLFDVASGWGMPEHEEDFGQTLGVWGVGPGNYVVLPFLGSSSVRDLAGRGVDLFTNPVRFVDPARDRYIIAGIYTIDLRAELLSIDSLVVGDDYLFLRDAYLQRRDYLVTDGLVDDEGFGDGFGDDSFGDEDFEEDLDDQ